MKCQNLILFFFFILGTAVLSAIAKFDLLANTKWHFSDAKSCPLLPSSDGDNFCHRSFSANATCRMARSGSSLMQSHDLGNLR